jgi:hypothetical protein
MLIVGWGCMGEWFSFQQCIVLVVAFTEGGACSNRNGRRQVKNRLRRVEVYTRGVSGEASPVGVSAMVGPEQEEQDDELLEVLLLLVVVALRAAEAV